MQPFSSEATPHCVPSGYRIDQPIYASATSRVFRALRQPDQQPVILKTLGSAHPQPAERARYQQEFDITRRLNAPGVIAAHGLETHGNAPVLVLEDCGGTSLDRWLARWHSAGTEAFPLAAFLDLAVRIAAALAWIADQARELRYDQLLNLLDGVAERAMDPPP